MSLWSCIREPVLSGHGTRYQVHERGDALQRGQALDHLERSAEFRDFLCQTIVASEYVALRWETPPVALDTLGRAFEFVLVGDAFLEMDPEPDTFGRYFVGEPADVLVKAIPNLGKTAQLVIPRELTSATAYVHLKKFLRHAPAAQTHALWRCVAQTARNALSAERLWVSTAGGGVSWLHVRIERDPKYYSYRPYARMSGNVP